MHIPAQLTQRTVDYSQKLSNWLLDLVFPPRCLGCRKFLSQRPPEYLCPACEHGISLRHGFECIECKAPSTLGVPCLACRTKIPLDQLLIASHYNEPLVERLIKAYKYRFALGIAMPLSRILSKYITFLNAKKSFSVFHDNPIIVPVPLHPYRLRWRGFNQSELLAKQIADKYQMIYAPGVLTRTKHMPPQASAEDRAMRLANMIELFSCAQPDKIRGRPVLLIDDVCTSGATLNACARVLKQNGAQNVYALVVARG